MIYTLTTNPAIDMNMVSDTIESGIVNRTRDAVYSPNGKGLNVSFVLNHFGISSGILGFFGGFSGDYIVTECKRQGYKILPVITEGTTRINVFVTVCNKEYKLVSRGEPVSAAEQQSMLDNISQLTDAELITINGSAANGMDLSYYDRLFEIFTKKNIDTVLDISSPKLIDLLKYKPLLIKPNDEELKEIFGLPTDTEENIIKSLVLLHTYGARNILLTLGEKGSYFYNGNEFYRCSAYPVTLKSSACAGDACLAAFLSVWYKNPDRIEEAMKLSAATGANVAESYGLGDFANVPLYKNKIEVFKI